MKEQKRNYRFNLRDVPEFTKTGEVIPLNKHKEFSDGEKSPRHTGNANIFKGSNGTIIHNVKRTLKQTAQRAGLHKFV